MSIFRHTRSGVTLVELVVTLVLVMLMSGLGVHVFGHVDRVFVRAEIEHLRAFIIYLQHKARLEKCQQILVFDLTKQSYTYNNTCYKLGHSVVFCSPPVPLHTDKKVGKKARKKEKKHGPCTFKHARVYCYPDGTLSAGTLYLAHRQRMRHTSYYALTCGVGHTSYIRIYCYKNNIWTLL